MKHKLQLFLGTVVTCGAILVFAGTFAHAGMYSHEEAELSPPTPRIAVKSDMPARLAIPAIGVNANVQHVGVGKSGNMAVPTNYRDVAWYREGTIPGERGSAVIDGHVDNGFGLNAVFHGLEQLQRGDEIFIKSHSGEVLRFVVERVQTYPAEEVPRDLVFNRADAPRLNLITCAGEWQPETKEYDERTVVYAVSSE